MKKPWHLLWLIGILNSCAYVETPNGRYLSVDLPVESSYTVHKTVTVDAPPGTTVTYGEVIPQEVYYFPQYQHDHRYRNNRYQRPNRTVRYVPYYAVPARRVFTIQGGAGSITQEYYYNR